MVFVIIADPLITDHMPTPIKGEFATRFTLGLQTEKLLPVTAGVGGRSRKTMTLEVTGEHRPAVTVHKNIFGPGASDCTVAVGLSALSIVATPPVPSVQAPVPFEGAVALSVEPAEQTV